MIIDLAATPRRPTQPAPSSPPARAVGLQPLKQNPTNEFDAAYHHMAILAIICLHEFRACNKFVPSNMNVLQSGIASGQLRCYYSNRYRSDQNLAQQYPNYPNKQTNQAFNLCEQVSSYQLQQPVSKSRIFSRELQRWKQPLDVSKHSQSHPQGCIPVHDIKPKSISPSAIAAVCACTLLDLYKVQEG